MWWHKFLPVWNGVSIILPPPVSASSLALYTDASDLGCGGTFGRHWFSVPWREGWLPGQCHINAREMFAVWVALCLWGKSLHGREIVMFTDNQSVVDVWKSGVTADGRMLGLLRRIFFFGARFNLNILVPHISGYWTHP